MDSVSGYRLGKPLHLGTNFGGDGRQTFALPNLQGKEPAAHLRYFIAVEGIYPSHS